MLKRLLRDFFGLLKLRDICRELSWERDNFGSLEHNPNNKMSLDLFKGGGFSKPDGLKTPALNSGPPPFRLERAQRGIPKSTVLHTCLVS